MNKKSKYAPVIILMMSLSILTMTLNGCGESMASSNTADISSENSSKLESQADSESDDSLDKSEQPLVDTAHEVEQTVTQESDEAEPETGDAAQEQPTHEETTTILIKSAPQVDNESQQTESEQYDAPISEEVIEITEENYDDYFEIEEQFITSYNGFDEPERYLYIARAVLKKEYVAGMPDCHVTVEYEYNTYQDLPYIVNENGDIIVTKDSSSVVETKSVIGDFIQSFEVNQPPYYMMIFSSSIDPKSEVFPYMADNFVLKRVKGTLEFAPIGGYQVESLYDVSNLEITCIVSNVNVRIGPATSARVVGTISKGEVFHPLAVVEDQVGATWYQIQLENGVIGFVRGDLVE